MYGWSNRKTCILVLWFHIILTLNQGCGSVKFYPAAPNYLEPDLTENAMKFKQKCIKNASENKNFAKTDKEIFSTI